MIGFIRWITVGILAAGLGACGPELEQHDLDQTDPALLSAVAALQALNSTPAAAPLPTITPSLAGTVRPVTVTGTTSVPQDPIPCFTGMTNALPTLSAIP